MPDPYTQIGPYRLPSSSVLLAFSLLIVLVIAVRRGRNPVGALIDTTLAGAILGLICARGMHVLLHWDHFAAHRDDILQLRAGELDWHAGVIGVLIGTWLIGRWRGINLVNYRDSLALGLPIIAFASWWGCGAANCAYGAEVPNMSAYPGLFVWEAGDIYGIIRPRFNTQALGMLLSALLLIVASVLTAKQILRGKVLGLMLVLLSLGMFTIGFMRGDGSGSGFGLRADQWLDMIIALFGLLLLRFYGNTTFEQDNFKYNDAVEAKGL